jgi:HAD superfamily hydrolase (TIGR01450 family)
MRLYKGYIFDMDGVLYRGDETIQDAVNAINILKDKDRKVMFITNNSSKLSSEYASKIKEIGISNVDENEVITSGDVAAMYLKNELQAHPNRRNVLCVSSESVKTLMKRIGMDVIDPKDYRKAHYVVAGITTEFNWELGDHAANAIAVYRAKFIGTNPDVAKPVPNGEIFAGTGAIISFIETASQTKATILGKPYPAMYNASLQRMELVKNDALMTGDLLNTDIKGASELGMDSAFVLTGLDKREDIEKYGVTPTYVIESLMELVK